MPPFGRRIIVRDLSKADLQAEPSYRLKVILGDSCFFWVREGIGVVVSGGIRASAYIDCNTYPLVRGHSGRTGQWKGLALRLFSVAKPTNQQTAAPRPPASPDLSPVTEISGSSYCRSRSTIWTLWVQWPVGGGERPGASGAPKTGWVKAASRPYLQVKKIRRGLKILCRVSYHRSFVRRQTEVPREQRQSLTLAASRAVVARDRVSVVREPHT
jgi:hypothetical protein